MICPFGIMKKRDLEIKLESVSRFNDPDPSLEQYPTPSVIASDMLFMAYANGDIAERTVNDLGCGTGIFSIGAWLLNGDVAGFDISESAVNTAISNAEKFDADIEFGICDVSDVKRKADTTIMNPPFGSQNKHADRPFLEKAMELSDTVYSLHMQRTFPFLQEYVSECGKEICFHKTYKYQIPHTFSFHTKNEHSIDLVMIVIR